MPYVYIMSNTKRGTLYTGSTVNLEGRVWQHKTKDKPGSFTEKYNLKKLVFYEKCQWFTQSIQREKQLKRWRRNWKIQLIESQNPHWEDLAANWYEEIPARKQG